MSLPKKQKSSFGTRFDNEKGESGTEVRLNGTVNNKKIKICQRSLELT